jgi:hypothetical protein|uniref:Uncharacterized protein n=1 Tax=uncultured organism MedDCM-OCT-S09-C25 TaxID=743649 RepID=D6PL11_9ZZZZ|nr:hypothetical protein [uncultured organism MedDCM-OCT-S09-C25]
MAHITREDEIRLRTVVQSYAYLETEQIGLPEVRERIAELKKEKDEVPWNPIPKVDVRKGLEGLEASRDFLNEVLASMKDALHLKLVDKTWWLDNGLDERVPCSVRRLTYFNEWVVKSRIPDPNHQGKTLRVLKPFLQVYNEFIANVRTERDRRLAAINNTKWYTDWDDSMLHARLRLAAGSDLDRCKEVCKAKKKQYKVRLALEWNLPYETQIDWVESQKGKPNEDGLPQLLPDRRVAPRRVPVQPEEETRFGGSEVASSLGMPIPNLNMLRLGDAASNPKCQATEVDNLPWERFYAAVKGGDKSLVVKLIRHSRVRDRFAEDYTDHHGRTIIHVAAWGGSREVIQWLLDERSDTEMRVNQSRKHAWLEARDDDFWTPLFTACWWGNKFAAEALIRFGSDLEARDLNGCFPVERAYMAGRNELVEHLVTMMVIPAEQNFLRTTVDMQKDPYTNPNFMLKVDDNEFLMTLMRESRTGSESRRGDRIISRSGQIVDRKTLASGVLLTDTERSNIPAPEFLSLSVPSAIDEITSAGSASSPAESTSSNVTALTGMTGLSSRVSSMSRP